MYCELSGKTFQQHLKEETVHKLLNCMKFHCKMNACLRGMSFKTVYVKRGVKNIQ